MASFVIRPVKWVAIRLLHRSPLVRTTDRVEAAVFTLAAALVVLAGPGAAAIGMTVYANEAQDYSAQAQTRHAVVATATDDSHPTVSTKPSASTVHARWQFRGVDHVDAVVTDTTLKAGEPVDIWVDGTGNRVDRPTPAAAAEMDAVITAVAVWLIVALFAGFTTAAVAVHLAIVRDAQWDLDLRSLVEKGGGRTSAP